MAKALYLFTGLTPNIKGHPYFNITTFSQYLYYLTNHYDYVKLTADNYRINSGVVKIENSNYINKTFTYAVEVEENESVISEPHRCYFIDTITEQSGMFYLQLSIDYWGTYYSRFNIDYLHITRCNRNIGNGFYDGIKAIKANNGYEVQRLKINNAETLGINNVYLVIEVSYNVVEAVLGIGDTVSTTNLFAIKLTDLKNEYKNSDEEYEAPLDEMIIDFIGGIYGISGRFDWFYNLDAKALKAYLILLPTNILESGVTLKSKSTIHEDGEIEIFANAMKVAREIRQYHLTPDINYDYFASVERAKGLQLSRPTNTGAGDNDFTFEFIFEYKRSNLQVYVKQGAEELDITASFEVSIVGNAETKTAVENIARNIEITTGAINSAVRGFRKSRIAGAVLGEAEYQAHLYSNTSAGLTTYIVGESNGILTFDIAYENAHTGFVRVPYCLNKYLSTIDEKQHARYFGAQFDEIYENVNDIFTHELLGTGDYNLTYLIADEVKVNNLPSIARQQIENAFNSGIELFNYEGTANE